MGVEGGQEVLEVLVHSQPCLSICKQPASIQQQQPSAHGQGDSASSGIRRPSFPQCWCTYGWSYPCGNFITRSNDGAASNPELRSSSLRRRVFRRHGRVFLRVLIGEGKDNLTGARQAHLFSRHFFNCFGI